jgi:glycerol-3-phosphate dehydrogenase
MRNYDVVIIGGGATGTATFRDLSMRGFHPALIEKNSLASGTTFASHQNLVGGMRYVITDPITAKECASENEIISRIAPTLVGKTDNYFVGFRNDYTEQALKKAEELRVIFRKKDADEVKKEIPALSNNIDIVIETEDRNFDAVGFCRLNCLSAKKNGGDLVENTQISNINCDGNEFLLSTSEGKIASTYIVNATGAWVNFIANKVHVNLPVLYNQGTIIVQRTLSPRGLQFFHAPSDADAYIVHGREAWLGTTSTNLEDLYEAGPEPRVEEYLTRKFSVILPCVLRRKVLRKTTGIRALYTKKSNANGRKLTRNFTIIEKPEHFFHVIGGKLTTARLMAEKISDAICNKAGKSVCRTHIEPLCKNKQ